MPGRRAPQDARREQIIAAAHAVALRVGIDGLTLRAVGAEAQLSHGLVVFYFKKKDQLVAAVLDRVLSTAAMLHVREDVARLPNAPDRLRALLGQETARFARESRDIRLFFEYWALGVREAAIRRKIGAALERYRAAFLVLAKDMVAAAGEDALPADVTPAALAAVAVSLVTGYAVQAMSDPTHFDGAGYLAAAQALVERPAPAAAGREATAKASGPTRRAARGPRH